MKDLARSGISPEDADEAGIYSVKDASRVFPEFDPLPALVIPYYDPWYEDEDGDIALFDFERGGKTLDFARVRYLLSPTQAKSFTKKKRQRYGQPRSSPVLPYFPVTELFDWVEVAADPKQEIVITEGEKKALAGCLAGVPTVGLGGVYNFIEEGELLEALRRFIWAKRNVYLNYDSDAAENPNIQAAEARLAQKLSMDRRANVFLTRLDPTEDGDKQGIDDLLVASGKSAWHDALRGSRQLRKADSMVLEMNKDICWIDKEERVYEFKSGHLFQKTSLLSGSHYSTKKIEVPMQKGNGTKKVSVAQSWLSHEHALRYSDLVFDPSTQDPVVTKDGLRCLNIFKGLYGEEGDVSLFLELHDHICGHLSAENREFLFNVIAYKVQNPAEKIPLCPVLVGYGGSGKSAWAYTIAQAVAPYGQLIGSNVLLSDYNDYVEQGLVLVIDEAQSEHMRKGRDKLKSLISEPTQLLNVKFRVFKDVQNPGFYILTSNDRSVAQFEHDDRRFFVIDIRRAKSADFYARYFDWLHKENGAKKVLNYLQEYDLQGWRPPARAPVTDEKRRAYLFSLSEVQEIAERMKESGNESLILQWLDQAMMWAYANESGIGNGALATQASEVRASVNVMPVRPFYNARELAMIFPHLAFTLHNAKLRQTPANRLAQELMDVGIWYIRNPDHIGGHMWKGSRDYYFVVSHMDEVPEEMSQNEFDRQMRGVKSYAQLRKKG